MTQKFYQNTPNKDFYLDLWEPIEVKKTVNDKLVEITSKYEKRPDLFAHDYLGDASLWHVLFLRNKDILIDPIEDFNAGKKIYVPAKLN